MKKILHYFHNPQVIAVIVAALGYFVDVYDLVLFSVVRISSLSDLGLSSEEQFSVGIQLLNIQMIGMLSGGILFGVLGDKYGRLQVLLASILLYSLANIGNAFISSVPQYFILRFLAGVGLAGELGIGITLVAELLPTEKRGIGTTIVATVGVCGAVVAATLGQFYSWRLTYLIGGLMGLSLLFLRVRIQESILFSEVIKSNHPRGDLWLLFSSPKRCFKYMLCVLAGVPIWFSIGVLVTFCPEIAKAAGYTVLPSAAEAIKFTYIGLVVGDLSSGLISQKLRSRKKSMIAFILFNGLAIAVFMSPLITTATFLVWWCIPLGFSVGYWAVLVTTSAEQFGTNLRATVATSVPNFVRGSVPILSFLIEYLRGFMSTTKSISIVGSGIIGIALVATLLLKESFNNDLDWIEESPDRYKK
jgi:putative MFS transporter